MRQAAILFAIAVLSAWSTPAAGAEPNAITEPDWIAKPNGDDLSRAYPPLAVMFQISGKAIISCQVDAFGKLKACRIDAETPENLGFGAAALSMTPSFQMRPKSLNGTFVEGGEVRIPLRFLLPYQPEPPPQPLSSPRALELSRRLVALSANADSTGAQIEGVAVQLDRAKTVVPAYGQIATALRESYPPRAAQAREFAAALLSNTFTENELTLLVAYASTPAGSMQMGPAGKDREVLDSIGKGLNRTALTRAREFFCQDGGCPEAGEAALAPPTEKLFDSISAPIWSQQPSPQVIEKFLPPAARALRIPGAARLTCIVGPLGVIGDCTVAGESPKGLGFAASAKSLATYYRLSPNLLMQGAAGKHVTIDIGFAAARDDAVELLPEIKPRSPHALVLARELIEQQYSGPGVQAALHGLMDEQRKLATPSDLTPAEFDRFTDALARGIQAALEQGQVISAAYVTTRMSDEQITAAIRFWRGPVGKAWKAKSPELMAQQASTGLIYGRLVLADAGRAFCRVNDCDGMTLKPRPDSKLAQPGSSPSSAPSTRTP